MRKKERESEKVEKENPILLLLSAVEKFLERIKKVKRERSEELDRIKKALATEGT